MEPLIKDLALILIVAGAMTLLFKKLRQPLVLGYIVAGFLVSPNMPYMSSVTDLANIKLWSDIGVIFLLFALGLEFSFKKLLKMGATPFIAAGAIIISMMFLGGAVGAAFGWSKMNCIFLGGMLAMSSTTIIFKAFDDMGLRQQRFAGLVLSVLIIEDILAGVKCPKTRYKVIPDRREAIAWAMQNHRSGDLLLLCGKGHETYQIVGRDKLHMDEREIVAENLAK